jgi:hypothetical protein
MPEAPVNEHRNLPAREDDVGPHAYPGRQIDPVIYPVPVTKPMQLAAERDLGLGVRPPVGAHVARPALVHRLRISPLLNRIGLHMAMIIF